METLIKISDKDRRALQSIVDLPASSSARESVLDAAASLAVVLEAEQMQTMKKAAQSLLTFRLPMPSSVDALNIHQVEGALSAAEVLQRNLEVQKAAIEKAASQTVSPVIKEAAAKVLQTTVKVFDEVEILRWYLLNSQAERDLDAGLGKSFGNVDAALAFLRRID